MLQLSRFLDLWVLVNLEHPEDVAKAFPGSTSSPTLPVLDTGSFGTRVAHPQRWPQLGRLHKWS